jgi:hypothetical protein
MVKNILLVNARLLILLLSETAGGRLHDKRLAEVTPYPFPAGSRLWQELSFLAFTLPQVEILMPTKHHAVRRCHWCSNGPTRPCITIGYGSCMSTAASSAVVSSKTGSGCGGTVSATS